MKKISCKLILVLTLCLLQNLCQSSLPGYSFANNSFTGMLYSAGASDPASIYDVGNASGAFKNKTPKEKEKVFLTIQAAFDSYIKANPSKTVGIELYKAVEADLQKNQMLNFSNPGNNKAQVTTKNKPSTNNVNVASLNSKGKLYTVAKAPEAKTAPSTPAPIMALVTPVQTASPKLEFKDKYFQSMSKMNLDAFGIYAKLKSEGLLTKSGMDSQKEVGQIIQGITKPEVKKGQIALQQAAAQEILVKLQLAGYLRKE
jgi:hypothetical protein